MKYVTKVRPKSFASVSYDFVDEKGNVFATVERSQLGVALNANAATIIHQNEKYLLVDAVTVAATHVGGDQRSVNTYISKNDVKLYELRYQKLASNKHYVIESLADHHEVELFMNRWAAYTIYEKREEIGVMKTPGILFRGSSIKLNKVVPPLMQVLIFWGSMNTQNRV